MIARDKPLAAAAIASELAAELYGLQVVKSHIEDNSSNTTRFLMISRESLFQGDKYSMFFSTTHKAGQLFRVLELFATAGINLSRISSMPLRHDVGEYGFFMDFEGSSKDQAIVTILKSIEERVASFRLLGCYPSS